MGYGEIKQKCTNCGRYPFCNRIIVVDTPEDTNCLNWVKRNVIHVEKSKEANYADKKDKGFFKVFKS